MDNEHLQWPSLIKHYVVEDNLQLPNNATIGLSALQCLAPGEWLNDEVVNISFYDLQQRDNLFKHQLRSLQSQLQSCQEQVEQQGLPTAEQQQQMQSLVTKLETAQKRPSCHFFSSFFMSRLYLDPANKGKVKYSNVRRWTLPAALQRAGQASFADGVLSCRFVLAPVNLSNMHWVLLVADLKACQIFYLDPVEGAVSSLISS